MVDRDVLITRVIDGEASAEDWSALHAIAREDPGIWSDLATAQQDAAELRAMVRELSACSDRVEAPVVEHAGHGLCVRLRRAGMWGGWLVAGAMALSWGVGMAGAGAGAQSAGLVSMHEAKERVLPELSPEEAFAAYVANGVRSGRVVAIDPELRIIGAQRDEDGEGFEVLYVRRIVERADIELYRLGQDERGNILRLPVDELPMAEAPF